MELLYTGITRANDWSYWSDRRRQRPLLRCAISRPAALVEAEASGPRASKISSLRADLGMTG